MLIKENIVDEEWFNLYRKTELALLYVSQANFSLLIIVRWKISMKLHRVVGDAGRCVVVEPPDIEPRSFSWPFVLQLPRIAKHARRK